MSLIESIVISDCIALSLDLSVKEGFSEDSDGDVALISNASLPLDVDAFSGPVDVEVVNVESVELVLRNSNRFLRHLFMDNVAYVETLLGAADGDGRGAGEADDGGDILWMTREELYLYVIIVLGALLLITWTAIPIAVLCVRKGR